MKKHRYLFSYCPAGELDRMCKAAEDEGWEVMNAHVAVQLIPGAHPGSAGMSAMGIMSLRIERNAPETNMEKEAKLAADSRIIRPGAN